MRKQTCDCCKEEFLSDNRLEALEEFEKNKPYMSQLMPEDKDVNDVGVICDDCYQKIKQVYPGLV